MTTLSFKNLQQHTIDFTRKYIGFYDGLFIGSLLVAFAVPDPFESFFFGVTLYAVINAVVKNARPTLTVVVTREGPRIIETN